MPNRLRVGLFGWLQGDFGEGPGSDTGQPIWQAASFIPSPGNVQAIIDLADQFDIIAALRFSGTPKSVVDLRPDGTGDFNWNKFEENVRAYENISEVADAIARRRVLCFSTDEPHIKFYNNTFSLVDQNNAGLLHKAIWPGAVVVQRSNWNTLTPPPAGGWTGLDYGWAQFQRSSALTNGNGAAARRAWFQDSKTRLAAIDLGMCISHNWLDGGDGRLWDYLNNGTSSGRVPGNLGEPWWLAAPSEIVETIDACYDDPDCPLFLFWTNGERQGAEWAAYQLRSDFVAAFDYAITKGRTRPLWNGFRPIKGDPGGEPPPPPPPPNDPGTIDHAWVLQATRQTTAATAYADVPGATLAADQFTAGKKYLLRVEARLDMNDLNLNGFCRVAHGGTAFPRSEVSFQSFGSTANRHLYQKFLLWTAVAGEAVSVQFKVESGGTIGAQFVSIVAIQLSDDLVQGVDYLHAEDTDALGLTSSYADGAAVTFTPPAAGEPWLVLGEAHVAGPSLSASVASRLNVSGGATATDPEVLLEGEDSLDQYLLPTVRVVTLDAVSTTIKEQSRNTGAGGTRTGSQVFVLRLSKFRNYAAFYSDTLVPFATANGAPSYGDNLATVSLTPDEAGDVYILGGAVHFMNELGTCATQRLQVNDADEPAGQSGTDWRLMVTWDATQLSPITHQALASLTAGLQTIDLDGAHDFSPDPAAGYRGRCLVAFTMRLAGSAAPTAVRHKKTRGGMGIGTKVGVRKAGT